MNVLSVFVAIVLAFLILYANNFLIRRRKQEFGIYMLLWMPKRNISKILVYETMAVGVLSLLSGFLLGGFCSWLLGLFSAGMLQVAVSFHFIFSLSSAVSTIVSFTVIFIIIMLWEYQSHCKGKADLSPPGKEKDGKSKNAQLMDFSSVLLLSYTAWYCLLHGDRFITDVCCYVASPILSIGGIGTILFFMSLSGFLIQFIRL